jgi:hypothetical protein
MSNDGMKFTPDWKTIAVLAASETDPDKVFDLANQLIAALDEDITTVLGQATPESSNKAA